MRRWRGKSQSRVKDVCATLGGGGVDRLQRRQVTIAIGWNGQINRATAAEALHPAQLQPRWDDDFQRGSRDRGRERSPLAIGVAPTCTMERSPVLSRRSPRGRTGEVAIRFALQIENQYDHHYGNCNLPCYNRQPVYKTPFCKREKLPIQFCLPIRVCHDGMVVRCQCAEPNSRPAAQTATRPEIANKNVPSFRVSILS